MTLDLLAKGVDLLGLDITAAQYAQFEAYAAEIIAWNRKLNLTAITDIEGIQTKHFVDSLLCFLGFPVVERPDGPRPLASLSSLAGTTVMDVGAGAGFPGIPLAIARPRMSVMLLESTGKKAAFLEHIARALGLEGVSVLTRRAEEAAQLPGHRERYDVVVARAVAGLSVLSEYCLPFVRVGGRFVAPKKGEIEKEIDSARQAVQTLGGHISSVVPVELPGLLTARVLVLIDKVRSTPEQYPRRPGMPEKRPLGA